ncbi:helix-turn-helix domain-containing protein [Zhihengliuella halotolerans]|uniref:helix-turn-helix domain-containing protein n=1 Tax=Zhihengliuella halotolerans TaxID=370736 RepID=UPI000C80762A|nr:helix-turn-helix transcriptional regulator [Zhihengliuella halotolerans]
MQLTPAQVIGRNVKAKRNESKMTAKQLGERLGEIFPKTVKDGSPSPAPWPTSTVYMLEAGDRAMVAAEILALAHIFQVSPGSLFIPNERPEDKEEISEVTLGATSLPPEALMPPLGPEGSPLARAGDALEALRSATTHLRTLANSQWILVDDVISALRGEEPMQVPQGNRPEDFLLQFALNQADMNYSGKSPDLRDLPSITKDNDDGE